MRNDIGDNTVKITHHALQPHTNQLQRHAFKLAHSFLCIKLITGARHVLSLIPRPFPPPPVFDCLQYANTEGEGLGDLVMCGYVR